MPAIRENLRPSSLAKADAKPVGKRLAEVFPGCSYLRPKEVADFMNVTERHLVDLILEGQLCAINMACGGANKRSAWRIAVSDVEAFLESRKSV